MSTGKNYNHLTWADRLKIETLYNEGNSQADIARKIQTSPSTICRELKRGMCVQMNSDLTKEMRYVADYAQKRATEERKKCGRQLKIGKDLHYANYLERRIKEGYSPAAVLGELKAKGIDVFFDTSICTVTLYSYIEKGIFLELTNKDLPIKKDKKRKYHKVKVQKRANAGTSIEKRPPEIDAREEFGHWEMDSVVGPQGKSKRTLLVLSERKTRWEIIRKLADHTAESVVKALDDIEREWKEMFGNVFKTITMDNGTEFSDVDGLKRSCLSEEERVDLYYCHPYRSSERGTNENTNRMIRRKIPKGVNFDNKTEDEIQEIENWINTYPRKIHGYKTAKDMFDQEIAAIR